MTHGGWKAPSTISGEAISAVACSWVMMIARKSARNRRLFQSGSDQEHFSAVTGGLVPVVQQLLQPLLGPKGPQATLAARWGFSSSATCSQLLSLLVHVLEPMVGFELH